MVSLPPDLRAQLYFDGAWNDISRSLRATEPVTFKRGLTSESASEAEPTGAECVLDNRSDDYSPRNPRSRLKGKIGHNTPMRLGYRVGSPWAEFAGGLGSDAIQTPDSAALDIAGDFDLRVDIALEDWSESQMICLRYVPSANDCWALEMIDGFPTLLWSPDGTLASRLVQTCTAQLKAHHGQRLALRVTLDIDNGAGGYELRFYTGRTVDDDEWDLLGLPITGVGTTSVFTGTADLEFGHGSAFNALPSGGVLNRMRGKAFALKLLSGIAGTVAVSMSTASAAVEASSFTDATGLVWTKQGNAVLTNHHVRMSGEVPAWPPSRDLTGNDRTVALAPTGVTSRMDAGNKPIDSALLRFLKIRGPIECWPLTDGVDATVAKSLVGGRDMRQILASTDTSGNFAQGALADWIEPVIAIPPDTSGRIVGGVPNSASAAAAWSVDVFLRGGGNESAGALVISDQGAGTDADNMIEFFITFNGNLDSLATTWTAYGDTSSSTALLTSGAGAQIYDEQLHHIRLTIDPQASSSLWEMYVDGALLDSGTIPAVVVKAVRTVDLRWGFLTLTGETMTERGYGYVTYWDGTGPTAAEMWDAANGYPGERAGARIERLAAESGYTVSVAGAEEYQTLLGIQRRKKLLALLNEASRSNFGYLLERRDGNEVIHRGHSTLWNQSPAITLDFRAGVISSPFKPVDDTKLIENDVSVRRDGGSVPSRQVLEEGPLSVLDPEQGGAGRYDNEYTYSLYEDSQAAQIAYLRLHLGTYNGVRYTRITLDLANPRVHQMIDAILRADCGDKIRLTGLPDDHGPDDVDVLINGYTEEAGPKAWKITFNCVPAEPWTAAVVGSTLYGRVDTAGCELAEALDSTETGVDVLTTALYRWVDSATYPSDFPFDVKTGGEAMRVTACTYWLRDSFTRSVASGWGTPDTGSAWSTVGGGPATDYNVGSGYGSQTLSTVDVSRRTAVTAIHPDSDIYCDVTTSDLATGDSLYGGVAARMIDANNMYVCRVAFTIGNAIVVTIRKLVAGVQTQLGATYTVPVTHVAGAFVRVRFQVAGSTLRAKAWMASGVEPFVWQITASDTAFTAANQIGTRSIRVTGNSNAVTAAIRYDEFNVVNPQGFAVVRGVNGVQIEHPSGQDIRLAHPVYVAL
ncbi:hypothetical protein [Streptomyces sp. NPDC058614]|uniref:hypothetical protein n=1 Tax=Streptomyces sp. NPDC058614 TaxID=3346557 RepID=UPI0036650A3B